MENCNVQMCYFKNIFVRLCLVETFIYDFPKRLDPIYEFELLVCYSLYLDCKTTLTRNNS